MMNTLKPYLHLIIKSILISLLRLSLFIYKGTWLDDQRNLKDLLFIKHHWYFLLWLHCLQIGQVSFKLIWNTHWSHNHSLNCRLMNVFWELPFFLLPCNTLQGLCSFLARSSAGQKSGSSVVGLLGMALLLKFQCCLGSVPSSWRSGEVAAWLIRIIRPCSWRLNATSLQAFCWGLPAPQNHPLFSDIQFLHLKFVGQVPVTVQNLTYVIYLWPQDSDLMSSYD